MIQDALATLTDPDGAYIGLTDFLNEGTFAWVDGTAVCEKKTFLFVETIQGITKPSSVVFMINEILQIGFTIGRP